MDRTLDALSRDMFSKTVVVLARLVERGVPVMIVQTLRTPAEAAQNIANGTSATTHSKHLSRADRGLATLEESDKCDAIDLCPYEVFQIHGPDKLAWNEQATLETQRAWAAIGEEGEQQNLRWGGRWRIPHDPGHLELIMTTDYHTLATRIT